MSTATSTPWQHLYIPCTVSTTTRHITMKSALLAAALIPAALASVGDGLPAYKTCLADCQGLCPDTSPKYSQDSTNWVAKTLLQWDCDLDCDYKCQQKVTRQRTAEGLPMVQFYGKWPFKRIFGITEFFLTVFSLGNLYVNYRNYFKVKRQHKLAAYKDSDLATMYAQYLLLLSVSIAGWFCSALFHMRDFPATETLDYVGAGAIIAANLNAIVVRRYELFRSEKSKTRKFVQTALVAALFLHYLKLYYKWDYTYNMRFNVVLGLSALALWIIHSVSVHRQYLRRPHFFNNSIHLLPYETRILNKLNLVGLSRTKYIPLIPVALNIFLLAAASLEMTDFDPIASLVDAHSLWHLCTIIPPIVWYDWNIWDVEMTGLQAKVQKS